MTTISDQPLSRVIALEGAYNFRDMGGYEAADGRSVKYGVLFRSDELGALTERDVETLGRLALRTIVDYRSEGEADRSPTPAVSGAVYGRFDANPVAAGASGRTEDYIRSGALNRAAMIAMYARLPFANPAYRHLLAALADGERHGILHHCAGGKDRTGVGALLILKLLGVSDETIMSDYLLTNETLGPKMQRLLEQMADKFDAEQLGNMKDVFAADADYLNAAIDAVIERYGSWEAYFEAEFGLTADRREQVRALCLV